MENKMKTADAIVMKLAMSDEPYFISDHVCYCALCPTKGHEDDDRVAMLDGAPRQSDDGLSIMGHVSDCAWRQAVEYVTAQKKAAKKGKRK